MYNHKSPHSRKYGLLMWTGKGSSLTLGKHIDIIMLVMRSNALIVMGEAFFYD